MMRSRYLCSGLSLFLLYVTTAKADHPTIAFGGEGVGAINTISSTSMPLGSWGMGIRSEIFSNKEFSNEQLENFAANGLEGVHSMDRIMSTSFSLSYGATENFSINARLPYIRRENIREGEIEDGLAEAHSHGDSSGVGDLLLLAQYRVMNRSSYDVSILFGIKTPTGETDVSDDEGIRFETEFQPGSGSWDCLLGVSLSQRGEKFGYHANILYNKTTEGSQSTEIGDALSYNAALTYRLNDKHDTHDHKHSETSKTKVLKWDFSVEINGETRRKNRVSSVSEDNSGGTTVYITPGFRVTSKNLSGFISYGIPIEEDQNGTQTDVDNRIVTGFSLTL